MHVWGVVTGYSSRTGGNPRTARTRRRALASARAPDSESQNYHVYVHFPSLK